MMNNKCGECHFYNNELVRCVWECNKYPEDKACKYFDPEIPLPIELVARRYKYKKIAYARIEGYIHEDNIKKGK